MHVIFYEKPGCAGNARQKALLRAAGHTLEVRDLLRWPWGAMELLAFLGPLPVADWFNRAAPRVKSGAVAPERVTATRAIDLLLAEPLLIRRPLMELANGERMVGFDTERVHAWLGLGPSAPRGASLEGCVSTEAQAAAPTSCESEKPA
jgi:nitrogenase-associated protein